MIYALLFVAGDVFGTEVTKTWEFSSDNPIRSAVLSHTLFLPLFAFLEVRLMRFENIKMLPCKYVS